MMVLGSCSGSSFSSSSFCSSCQHKTKLFTQYIKQYKESLLIHVLSRLFKQQFKQGKFQFSDYYHATASKKLAIIIIEELSFPAGKYAGEGNSTIFSIDRFAKVW